MLESFKTQLTQLDTATVLLLLSKTDNTLQADYQALSAALEQSDRKSIRQKAHQMKGTASLSGCQSLIDCLEAIEQEISFADEIGRQVLREQLTRDYTHCRQLLTKLRQDFS